MPDHELNEVLEAHAAEELDGLSIQNQRLARVQEYEEASVSRSDPFAAVIGMGNAYFQRVFEHLGAAILDELDSRAHTVEELREFAREFACWSNCEIQLRQILQFSLPMPGNRQRRSVASDPRSEKIGD
jgi:hypothetical protein